MYNLIVNKELLIYAFKYSLGRMTFAPITVCDEIKKNLNIFSQSEIQFIIEEIEKCNNYGMDFDKTHWISFTNYLKDNIKSAINNDIDVVVSRDILIYAFRYCLGYNSNKLFMIKEAIECNINNISNFDINLFVREIKEYQSYGAKYHNEYFSMFLKFLENINNNL